MKISVIIPIYNVEDYLEECIDSVLNQSYQDIEILLVNDGSTDKSSDICERYSNKYSNIRFINKTNGGLSDARNAGIKNSTGDYLIFLDSDDYWGKDFLISIVNLIYQDPEIDYVFFSFSYYYQVSNRFKKEELNFKEEQIRIKTGLEVLKEILVADQFFQWIACRGLIKRDFLIEKGIYFEIGRHYEDVLWTPKVFINAKKVDYYDDDIYVYRLEREGQITSNFNYKNLSDSLYASSYWDTELDNYKLDYRTKRLLMKNLVSRYYFAIWFLRFVNSGDRKLLIKELRSSKHLLKYNSNFITSTTSILCNLIGFNATSIIFKYMILLKRKLKKIKDKIK